MKKGTLIILLSLSMLFGASVQVNAQAKIAPQSEHLTKKDNKQVKNKVINDLKVVYGKYYNQNFENRPKRLQQYINFYKRCEYITMQQAEKEAPGQIKNLSNVMLISKYNPSVVKNGNFSGLDKNTFNIFEYGVNRYSKVTEYYQIFHTNTVIKVNKL